LKKNNIRDNLKQLNILFIKDQNCNCHKFEQLNMLLDKVTNKTVVVEDYSLGYDYFVENKNAIDLIIVLININNIESFSLISKIKKVSLDIPFLLIGDSNQSNFDAVNFVKKPVMFKELIEKIYLLCSINYSEIDKIILETDQEFQNRQNSLSLHKDELAEISSLIEDYESHIGELLFNGDIRPELVDTRELHVLLQKTYNMFFTFIDDEIKDAMEPFSIVLISFANTISNVQFDENTTEDVYEVVMLLLEDVVKYIESTVIKGEYIHSQYLIDSFIANLQYLQQRCHIDSKNLQKEEEQLEFF
jgi:hypothetical protein